MTTLPIADCRLSIGASRAGCCLARGGHDGSQIIGFLQQRGEFAGGGDAGFAEQLQPQRRLVRFLFDGADFGDKFRFASRAACRSVVGHDRSAAADDLPGGDLPRIIAFGNCSRQFNDAESKTLGSLLEFNRVHALKLSNQSPIANRQSTIPV